MTTNIHSTAICSREQVAENVTIGPYCVIEPGVTIAAGAIVSAQVLIARDTRIGANCRIGAGAKIGHGCTLEQNVTIGENAIIDDGIHLQIGARVNPGTMVGMPVPAYAIVSGRDAIISGYVDASPGLLPDLDVLAPNQPVESRVSGVSCFDMPEFPDLRGTLSVGEFGTRFPFLPRRYFLVYDVASERVRGEHAHKKCHQFLTCIHGACSVLADDGSNRQEFRLDRRNFGIHLPPMIWGIQYKFTRDAVLLVFASEHYDDTDYIRNYQEFVKLAIG